MYSIYRHTIDKFVLSRKADGHKNSDLYLKYKKNDTYLCTYIYKKKGHSSNRDT